MGNAAKKQGLNPYLPSWEYIPDGEPYVFGDRVYVYGSHDWYNGYVFCSGDYVCWSAPVDDLRDWRYEGVIYPRVGEDPINADGRMNLYAPDVTVGPDGRYYLYYVYDKVNIVSVAVCDTPAGQYKFHGYVHYKDGKRLGEREGDEPQFDPGVLTEGDTVYLYTGFCGFGDKSRTGAMVTELDARDMLTITEEPAFVVPGSCYSKGTGYEGHAFFEASSIRKVGEKYYFIYSSEVMHELCYATSDSPYEDFEFGGVLVSNCDIGIGTYKPAGKPMAFGGNNHGSMVEINGQWYIFYHRQTNGTWYSRQGCAEPLTIDENGHIAQVEITSCGLNGGPLSDIGPYKTYIVCNMLLADRDQKYVGGREFPRVMQDGADGDENPGYIGDIHDKAIMGFKYFDCHGVTGIRVQTRAYAHGFLEVRTSWDGEALCRIPVDNSNVWEDRTAECHIPDGVNALYFAFDGRGDLMFGEFELLH